MPGATREVQGAAAVALRTEGASFSNIAETLGMASAGEAYRAVCKHLALSLEDDTREDLRRQIDIQLDELLSATMIRATDEEDPEQLQAVGKAVAIIDRKTRLHGLDAPQEIVMYTPTTTELEQWVAQVTALSMPPQQEADIIGAIEAVSEDVTDEAPA